MKCILNIDSCCRYSRAFSIFCLFRVSLAITWFHLSLLNLLFTFFFWVNQAVAHTDSLNTMIDPQFASKHIVDEPTAYTLYVFVYSLQVYIYGFNVTASWRAHWMSFWKIKRKRVSRRVSMQQTYICSRSHTQEGTHKRIHTLTTKQLQTPEHQQRKVLETEKPGAWEALENYFGPKCWILTLK